MRSWQVMVLVAVLIAGTLSAAASHEPFEAKLVRLEVEQTLPALASTLREESPEINALFLSFASDQALWMSASLAIMRHGDTARERLSSLAFTRRTKCADVSLSCRYKTRAQGEAPEQQRDGCSHGGVPYQRERWRQDQRQADSQEDATFQP